MIEQEQSELLSRLLKLSAEEDAISTLDDKSFFQPWEYSDEGLSEAMERLKKLELENPSLQHLTQAAYSCYAQHQIRRLISETEKSACLKAWVSIFIPGRGWHYLSDAPDSETGKAMSHCVTDNILGGLTGTSKITFCGGIHFKFKPKKPGIEYAIHALDALLFPDQAVTNPSLFIKLRFMSDNGVKEEEALATQTVYGKTADKVTEESLQFEQAHFTQQCILQLLTAPGDGKLDNFIISENKLVGIDNEMAFEFELIKGEGKKGHVTFIHTFLFFLPQMKNCLDKNLLEQFKTLSAEKLFLLWLKELEARNSLYERLDRNNLKIIFDQGALKAVYQRLKAIQRFLRETPLDEIDKITGEMLFKAVMPEVFSYYQAIDEHLYDQPLQKKIEALQKTKRGDEDALNFEILNLPEPSSDKVMTEYKLEITKAYRKKLPIPKDEEPIPEETPDDAIKCLINWIDRSSLTLKEQEDFDNELVRGILRTQKLEFKDQNLTGAKLLNLTKGATLSYLYLENTQVKLEDLKKLMSFTGCLGLELCLGENSHLGLEAWQHLLHSPLCSHFSLKLPNGAVLILKGRSASSKILPSFYLQAVSQEKVRNKNKNQAYLDAIERLLIQEGYPIKSFDACLPQQSDQTASRFIVSSLRYLIIMLENREASPEQYLEYYLKLDKARRELNYKLISQVVSNKDRCEKIQNLIGDYPDSDGERRLNLVKEQCFRKQLSNIVGNENGKEIKESKETKEINENKIIIEGLTPGKACLDKDLTRNLVSEGWLTADNFNFERKKEKSKEKEKSEEKQKNAEKSEITITSNVLHGNHLVIPIDYNGSQLHIKVLPDFPGMEIAYSLLSNRIMGKGSPHVELWKWTYGQHHYPVLVSETIAGENLTPELLKAYPLEPLSYQQHVLMTMLVNPGDGNPGNFIAQKMKAADGSTQLRLMSIDNDRLFAPAFENGKLRTATIIYCFNEMQFSLHKDLRKQFLSLNAYEVLSYWLNSLESLNQQYCEIFTPLQLQQFMLGEVQNQPSYLLTMFKRETVAEVFRKIKTLQYWLSFEPQMPLMNLLSKIQPSLANHYQQMRVQYDEPIKRFEESVKNEYKREEIQGVKRYTSTMHMGQYLKMQGREVTTDKTVANYWKQDFTQAKQELKNLSVSREAIELAKIQLIQGNTKGFDDLPEAYAQEEVIASINFDRDIRNIHGKPDAEQQQKLIILITNSKGLKSLERLIVEHCAITDGQLEQLLRQLPKLKTLKITNCQNINSIFCQTALTQKIKINTLEECILQNMKGLTNFSITSHTIKYLSIKEAPNLKKFYFYSTSITQLRLSHVPQCYQFNIYAKELQEADFSENILLTDLHLQKIILQCGNLKQMNLQRCDEKKITYLSLKETLPIFAEKIPQNEEEKELLKSVAGKLSQIASNQAEELYLSETKNISGWIWKCFCVALSENTSVNKIYNRTSQLDTEDIIRLANALEKNPSVTELCLGNDPIGEKGSAALAMMIEKNQSLTEIEFRGSSISDNSVITLAPMLKKNHTLIKVSFEWNNIGDKGVIALAQMLENNQSLTEINLCLNNIGDQGTIALAQMLEKNKTLKKIDLRHNNVGDKSIVVLVKALEKNNTINKILLPGDTVSNALQLTLASITNNRLELIKASRSGDLFLSKIGLLPYLMPLAMKLTGENFSCQESYTSHAFQLNPFTFFSEHADRENALSFARNHEQQLYTCLKKSLDGWEMPVINDNFDSKKDIELKKTAQSFGFRCIAIAKNGNCLFEAISEQLKMILKDKKDHHNHKILRELAVEYLTRHQDFYQNFVEDHNFASFIRKMSLSGTWAENTVLNALAHILNVTIVVINSDGSQPVVLKKPQARGIIYLGYEVDTHYQILKRDLSILPEKSIDNPIDYAPELEAPSTHKPVELFNNDEEFEGFYLV